MSSIDWGAMLAGLEQQKTGLEQELADVDAVIDAVRQRSAPKVRVSDLAKGTPSAKRNGAKGGRASSAETDQARAKARKLYETGVAVEVIGKQLGRSGQTIYGWASVGKWKRPNPGAAAPAAAAPAKTPAGEQLGGSVKCTSPACGAWTDYDPCRVCGVKLKRDKW